MALNWQTEYHRYRRYFVNIGQYYQQKKARVYTGIVFSILTTSFFLVFAIKPTVVTIVGLLKKIEDQKLVAEKLEEKIGTLSQAQKQYLAIESDLLLVNQALPQDTQVSLLIKELEALGRQSGITVETIQFNQLTLKGKNPEEKQKEINFSFTASGNYQNLKNFLTSLNSLRRIVLVDNFSFTSDKEIDKKEFLNLSLSAQTFYYGKI